MKKLYDIKYGEQKENLLDIYIPDKNNFKTVVWIHGGGLEEGDKNGIHFAEDLLKLGYGLVTINYRLYPNAVFPDYIIDAAKGLHDRYHALPFGNVDSYCVHFKSPAF